MKKVMIRIVSLALTLVLSLSMLPQKAEAGILDMVKKNSSGTVSGYWTGEKFWRNNRYTEPFAFYSALNNCTGFTMDFELVEVYEGNLLSGDFKWEGYVHTTKVTWKSVKTFYLNDYETTVNVSFDPMSIDQVAVVCLKKSRVDYTYAMTIRNATYKSTSSNNSTKNNSSTNNTYSTGSKVSGQWADSVFRRSNRTTYPFEFYSPIRRCKGFTLNYEITEVSKGNLNGNFKYCVYVRTTGGEWKYVHEFTMKGYSTSTRVNFSGPMSIDAVAVFCLKNSNMSYSYTFSITNPITK